jgi:hypothetical protein
VIGRNLKLCHLSDMLKTETSAGMALRICLMTITNTAIVCYAERNPSRREGLLLDVDRISSAPEIYNDLHHQDFKLEAIKILKFCETSTQFRLFFI